MALDPRISLGVQPMQMPDPLAQYGKIAAIQQAQNQNALAQYQLSAAQREEEKTNALSRAYRDAYNPKTGAIDTNRLRMSLATGGFGAQLPAVEKSLLELENQKLTQQKTEGELFDQSMSQIRNLWGNVRTVDDALAVHYATHQDPIVGKRLQQLGITDEAGRQSILDAAKDPQTFAAFVKKAQLSAKDFQQMNLPQLSTKDTGGQIVDRTFEPLTGTITEVGRTGKTMTDYEKGILSQGERRISLESRRVAVAEEEAKQKRDPEFQRRMEYSKNLGQLAAKGDYAAQQEFQKVLPQAEQAVQLVDQLIGKRDTEGKLVKGAKAHPGFRGAVGMGGWETFGIPGIAQLTPGSDAADFKALYDQVTSGAFLQAFNSLRGAGAITEKEGEKATSAITRMKLSQSEPEFIKAAMEYQDVIRKGVAKAQSRATGAGGAAPVSPATPGIIDFGSLR